MPIKYVKNEGGRLLDIPQNPGGGILEEDAVGVS